MTVSTNDLQLTYQDYYLLDDGLRYELYKGKLIRVPAPDFEHQKISTKLFLKFGIFINQHQLGEIYHPPLDVKLSEHNVVQPDLLYISNQNLDVIHKRGIFGAPDLVVEIISPSSKYRATYEKKDLYEQFGVKEYWLVDPRNKNIEVMALNDSGKYELYSEGFLEEENQVVKSKVLNDFQIDLRNIFN